MKKISSTMRYFLLMKGLSDFSNWFPATVVPTLLYTITQNVTLTAVLIACKLVPNFAANYLVKVMGDRAVPSAVIIRFATLAETVLLPLYLVSSHPIHFFVLALISSGCSALSAPHYYTAIKQASQEHNLASSNNMSLAIKNTTMLIGPILGACLQNCLGAPIVLFISSFISFLSFLVSFEVRLEAKFSPRVRTSTSGYFCHIKNVFSTYPLLCRLILVDAISGLGFGALNTMIPISNQINHGNNPLVYSIMLSSLMGGMLAGNGIFHLFFSKRKSIALYLPVTIFGLTFFMVFSLSSLLVIGVLCLLLVGIGNSIQDVVVLTAIQETPDSDNEVSLIFSLRETSGAVTVLLSTFVIAAFITPELFIAVGVSLWFFATIGCLFCWFYTSNRAE